MAHLKRRLALVGAMLLAGAGAARAQANIAACETIQAADAYNQCLAKFGPASKVKSVEPEGPGDIKSSSEEAAAGAGPVKGHDKGHAAGATRRGRHGRGRAVRHVSGGRKRMTFTVRRRH